MASYIPIDIWDLIYNNSNEIYSRYEGFSYDSDDADEVKKTINAKFIKI